MSAQIVLPVNVVLACILLETLQRVTNVYTVPIPTPLEAHLARRARQDTAVQEPHNLRSVTWGRILRETLQHATHAQQERILTEQAAHLVWHALQGSAVRGLLNLWNVG